MQPKFSGTSSSNKEGSGRLLSPESVPSGGGTFVQPFEILCTHICGLQVAVAVGLEGDPLGRNVLGLSSLSPNNCGGGRGSWDSRSYGSSPLSGNNWHLLRKL